MPAMDALQIGNRRANIAGATRSYGSALLIFNITSP
jgi:hypothetical protein